jgi:hypothetical protein
MSGGQHESFADRVENWMRAKVAKDGVPKPGDLYHAYVKAHYADGGPSENCEAFYVINDVAALVRKWAEQRQ